MGDDLHEGSPDFPKNVGAQHGHIASKVSDLRRAHTSGESWDALARYLDRLLHDVRHHFAAEEAAMKRAFYERLGDHRNEHHVFMRRLEVVRRECDRKQTELMPLLTEMLETWFRRHEATWDREAADVLKDE